jgi:hypothetical protein
MKTGMNCRGRDDARALPDILASFGNHSVLFNKERRMPSVSALSKLQYVERHDPAIDDELGCQEDDHWSVWDDDFPDHHSDLLPGCYSETPATKTTGFNVPYSHYNW